jgi:hypothetical protein
MSSATTKLIDVDSTVMETVVPVSVVLPPDYQLDGDPLPLLINLHGGGADRTRLVESLPVWQAMWDASE